jgi:hypothetical protein
MTVSFWGQVGCSPHRWFLAGMRCGEQYLLTISLMGGSHPMQLSGPESGCKFGAVNTDQVTEWSEGTAADLVADARALNVNASTRMVTDWVEEGLLANPEPRKSTSHGSDARVFPPLQRELFTRLLAARERSPLGRVPYRSMVRVVLYMWLIDDQIVPTTQARRALRTHARATGITTASKRRANARAIVEQLAHPSATLKQRRAAQLVIETNERTGHFDWDKLTTVLTNLCSPWPTLPGVPRIERAIDTPLGPVTIQHHITMWHAKRQIVTRLRHEEIEEAVLDQVRVVFRKEWAAYQERRPMWEQQAGESAAYFAEPATLEGRAIQAVDAFVETLAGELGLIEAAAYKAEAARIRLGL